VADAASALGGAQQLGAAPPPPLPRLLDGLGELASAADAAADSLPPEALGLVVMPPTSKYPNPSPTPTVPNPQALGLVVTLVQAAAAALLLPPAGAGRSGRSPPGQAEARSEKKEFKAY